MGKVIVTAKIENLHDLLDVQMGRSTTDKIRSIEVMDAMVDTGANMLGMPQSLIAQLGLLPFRSRSVRTAAGTVTVMIYQSVRVTVQGRDCNCDVMELPEDCPVLIGQIPLEQLDFVIDPMKQRLIGNPDHGGQHMIDALSWGY
ncbi:MAG: retroviral-like aspartic protease family protein [Gemmataceae bacterium]